MSIVLPSSPPQRLAIRLTKAAERAVRKRHPWVYTSGIERKNKEGKAGDLAIIYDRSDNKLMAIGLYDPFSPIRIKLIHVGGPATIDAAFWEGQIEKAHARRKALLETDTNSYRLIHGEADQFPGLVADVYARVLVVKVYSTAWLVHLSAILPALEKVSQAEAIVLRLSRKVAAQKEELGGLEDGLLLKGELIQPEVVFREHGLLFSAHVIRGHKTGYFLDHRHNRKRVGELSKGKRVLDVFAYAGGFSVHALAGGAKEVISLDISEQALAMAKANVALNQLEGKHQTMAMDAFVGLDELYRNGESFDLIVVDPPSFAKRDAEVDRAKQSYFRLAKSAVRLVRPGGIIILASCSSRVTTDDFFATSIAGLQASGRSFQLLEKTDHDGDHPIVDWFPEGGYLKAGYFAVDQ
jgi:23S rRNA (cytosine1962-C5)-methyltransferase